MKTNKHTPGPEEQRAIDAPDDITVRINEYFKHEDGEDGDIAFIALSEIIDLRYKRDAMAAEIERLKAENAEMLAALREVFPVVDGMDISGEPDDEPIPFLVHLRTILAKYKE